MSKSSKANKESPAETAVVEAEVTRTVEVVEAASPVVAPRQSLAVSPELQERLAEAREALEDYEDVKFPLVKMKEGKFIVGEGGEPLDYLDGIILYTKANNVFYKSAYKAGVVALPDCFSRDGRVPSPEVKVPVSKACKGCPNNEYNSKPGTTGKACRNVRLVFILLRDTILPVVARIPPTSLKLVDSYILNATNMRGSYFNVMTRISVFKKEEAQAYHNWKLQMLDGVEGQAKADMKAVRDLWIDRMKALDAEATFEQDGDVDADVVRVETPAHEGRAF